MEAQGLAETVPFKGSRVRTLSEKDVRDNYSVCICLESKSIRDAITLLSEEELSKLVEQLQNILDEMEGYAGQGDLRHFTESDAAFHRAIIDATDNQVLLRLWEQCNMRNWSSVFALTESVSLKQLQRGHQQLLKELSSRNERAAVSTIEDHLTGLMDGFIKGVQH